MQRKIILVLFGACSRAAPSLLAQPAPFGAVVGRVFNPVNAGAAGNARAFTMKMASLNSVDSIGVSKTVGAVEFTPPGQSLRAAPE